MSFKVNNVCPACKSLQLSQWFAKPSAADGRRYQICRCAKCESGFVLPRPSTEYLEEYYTGSSQSHAKSIESCTQTEAYEKVLKEEQEFPNSELDATRITGYCRALTSGNNFLDIGAGYGFFSRAALKRGFQVTAIEPTKECRDVFRLMCGMEPVSGMLTCEFVRANSGSFDVVLMSQVLEHIADLDSTLRDLKDLLTPNGIVSIAVPHFGSWLSRFQGRSDMFIVPPEHVNLFSRAGLVALFEQHGLMCCEMHTISRVNVQRVQRRIPVPFFSHFVALGVAELMRLSDTFQRGMFINAYFRKCRA